MTFSLYLSFYLSISSISLQSLTDTNSSMSLDCMVTSELLFAFSQMISSNVLTQIRMSLLSSLYFSINSVKFATFGSTSFFNLSICSYFANYTIIFSNLSTCSLVAISSSFASKVALWSEISSDFLMSRSITFWRFCLIVSWILLVKTLNLLFYYLISTVSSPVLSWN